MTYSQTSFNIQVNTFINIQKYLRNAKNNLRRKGNVYRNAFNNCTTQIYCKFCIYQAAQCLHGSNRIRDLQLKCHIFAFNKNYSMDTLSLQP